LGCFTVILQGMKKYRFVTSFKNEWEIHQLDENKTGG